MARFERFEDIEAWQRARQLARQVYAATRTGQFSRDFGLRDQIQRAAVSVMANIAEGFERGSDREFLQFLSVAKASCAEVRSHLYVALDLGYIDEATFQVLVGESIGISRLLAGLMKYLQNSEFRGRKRR